MLKERFSGIRPSSAKFSCKKKNVVTESLEPGVAAEIFIQVPQGPQEQRNSRKKFLLFKTLERLIQCNTAWSKRYSPWLCSFSLSDKTGMSPCNNHALTAQRLRVVSRVNKSSSELQSTSTG